MNPMREARERIKVLNSENADLRRENHILLDDLRRAVGLIEANRTKAPVPETERNIEWLQS